MNIIFLTLLDFKTYSERNIYCDLLREFIKNGHEVYCISPTEKKIGTGTHFEENGHLLKLKIGNIQKTNLLEKGFSTMLIEPQFMAAIKKYFSHVKFDLVLYSTPPITFANAIDYIKKRDGAKTYLMLKDIFPQNAVDLGMMSKTGVKGLIYKYFRYKEKQLYSISDRIGCMSQANVDYVLEHNSEICEEKVEVCPNCIEVQNIEVTVAERKVIREKYGIPQDKTVFVYGGNLGKPQGISFLMQCLQKQTNNKDVFFLIVGDGTEYSKLNVFFNEIKPSNMRLMKSLPKEDYDILIAACDIGMIFLDYSFTIPNFPSRLLAYMQAGLPVFACTDVNTDIGKIIVDNGFGWWCKSDNVADFENAINNIGKEDLLSMKQNALEFLNNNYTVQQGYKIITD